MSKSRGRRPVQLPRQAKPRQSPGLGHSLEQAIAFHQRGRLAEAEPLYRAVLRQVPDHFAALHLLDYAET